MRGLRAAARPSGATGLALAIAFVAAAAAASAERAESAGSATAAGSAAAAPADRAFDYLVIEANEGGSSGGHAAVRFADETYHYQHETPGILRLTRVDSAEFAASYALIENRSIHASRVAVSDDTHRLLRDAFNERWLAQEAEIAHLRALGRERALLEAILAPSPAWRVRAAGLFAAGDSSIVSDASRAPGPPPGPGPETETEAAPALVRLRERIAAERGRDFTRDRSRALRAALARSFDGYEPTGEAAAAYADAFTGLVALDLLERGATLAPDAHAAPGGEDFTLSDGERAWLERYVARLEGDLIRLAGSDRPGWSVALLVGMARLVALRQSLDSGRLVVLDAFPDDAEHIGADALARQRHLLPALREDARDDLAVARAHLAGEAGDGEPREADWSRVETAANRVLEIDAAIANGRSLRVARGPLVPSRGAARSDLVLPDRPRAELAGDRARVDAAERDAARSLRDRHAYNLLTRNCVTELLRVVDAAVPAGEAAERLGGRVQPGEAGNFVPFVSGIAVAGRFRVVAETTAPSYRERRLAALRHDGASPGDWLREQSPLTSAIHRGNGERDSTFVFFTDELAPLRPALGAANLAVALGASATGLVRAPIDGGRSLSAGLRGVLFSLPELAFVSLRQGTFDHVPRHERESALAAYAGP